MKLKALWLQKKEHAKITNWLYELGKERRLGELPQFVKYKNKWISRNTPKADCQDIYDFAICHNTFVGDYYIKNYIDEHGQNREEHHVDNVRTSRRCMSRLCPICETIKARQEYTRLTWLMNQVKNDYDFYFLTLTLPSTHDKFTYLIDIMNKAWTSLSRTLYCYDDRNTQIFSGFYSTWEVTWNEKNGFHPHLHTILAIPKGYVIEERFSRKKEIKQLSIMTPQRKRPFVTSQYDIITRYVEIIERYYPDVFKDYLDKKKFFDVHFTKCYNIDNDVRELCKYLIDFTSLPNKEVFITYAQSIYKKNRKKRNGIFKWTEEKELAWRQFIDELHQQSIEQNKNSKETIFEFNINNLDELSITFLGYGLKYSSPHFIKFSVVKNE